MKISLFVFAVLLLSACSTQMSKPVKTSVPEPQIVAIPENKPVIISYQTLTRPTTDISIIAAGDVMLGGTATPYLEKNGYDYPFDTTRDLLRKADIAIVNLETALTDTDEVLVEKQFKFKNPPEKVIPALQNAGVDIVSLANNHTLDHGYQGLRDTLAALNQGGIAYHGAGFSEAAARQPVIIQRNQQKIGFLAYSNTFPKEFWAEKNRPGTAFGHQAHVKQDVAALTAQGIDIIVVSFHWGREGTTELRGYQPLLAKTAIDAGADLVIGHHPHVLQKIEEYKDGVILYSLGNFVFGSFSNNVQESALIQVNFKNGRYHNLDVTPLLVNNFKVYFQPKILIDAEAQQAYQDLNWWPQ